MLIVRVHDKAAPWTAMQIQRPCSLAITVEFTTLLLLLSELNVLVLSLTCSKDKTPHVWLQPSVL
jgi:hypothetical protein